MKVEVSILLPTRGRTDMLQRSLRSLYQNADDPTRLEFRLAFDDDDTDSSSWFMDHIAPELDEHGCAYEAIEYPRLGYARLNEYLNGLAQDARGRWLFFWGDDGLIHSKGWDSEIAKVKDFRVLRIPAHNEHPYAIWPIIPREWFEIFGYLSAHSLTDSWCSQIGYMLDIMQNIKVSATHDRFDLTGNNKDETYEDRVMLEGNPKDPKDFNHINWRNHRWNDAIKLFKVLDQRGQDMSWFKRVLEGKQDPWERMISPECDPNKQVGRQ